MRRYIGFYALFLLVLITLSACASLGSSQLETSQPTQTAIAEQPVTPEPTAITPSDDPRGTVSGRICFPSEQIPAMTLYLQNVDSGELVRISSEAGMSSFNVPLMPGRYVAYAYPQEMELGGGYTNAVTCGLKESCTDHSLIVFEIQSGQDTPGVDVCDWYAPDSIPLHPQSPAPAAAVDPALAGYSYNDIVASETWQVDANGNLQKLLDTAFAKISPDGRQALYEQESDIWIADLTSGERRNLTNTSWRTESNPQWWPANPGKILFTSWANTDEVGMSSGWPTLVNLDGSDYQVISEDQMATLPIPSPDGQTVAFDQGLTGWLYRLGGEMQTFDAAAFGLPTGSNFHMGSPAWSPDGSRLAWWVSGNVVSPDSIHRALVVFDLPSSSFIMLHPHQPVGGSGGWLPTPVWSPDGQWLAYTTMGEGSKATLYAGKSDGTLEYNLGDSTSPVWSPDGTRLAYTAWPPVNDSYLSAMTMQLEVASGNTAQLSGLPEGSVPNAWMAALSPSTGMTSQSKSLTERGWQTYTSQTYGFQVDIPAGSQILEEDGRTLVVLPFTAGTQLENKFVSIQVEPTSAESCYAAIPWRDTININGIEFRSLEGQGWEHAAGGLSFLASDNAAMVGEKCVRLASRVGVRDDSGFTGGTPLPTPLPADLDQSDLKQVIKSFRLQ
jgi:hypothetical protein